MEYESDSDTNCNPCGRIGNKNKSGDYPNDSTVKIGQNTEKSPGDVRKLAVSPSPLKDHQLMWVWKTLKGLK